MRLRREQPMFKLAIVAVCVCLLVSLVPSATVAQDEVPETGNLIAWGSADVVVASNDEVNVLFSFGSDVTIDGTVSDLLVVIGGDALVSGTVGGDVHILSGSLALAESATVGGDILLGNSSLSRAPGTTIQGSVDDGAFEAFLGLRGRGVYARIWMSLTIFCLVVALAIARTGSAQIDKVRDSLLQRPLITLGTGLLAVVLIPIAGLFLLFSIYVLPLGLLLLSLGPFLWIFGYIITGLVIGRVVLTRSGMLLQREARNPYAAAVIGILVLQLVVIIPLADLMVFFFAAVIGIGSLLVAALSRTELETAPDASMARPDHGGRPIPVVPPGRRRAIARVLVIWFVNTLALLLIAGLTPLISFGSATAALVLAAVIGVFNALIRPLILRITLPLTVLTMGLFVLYVDAVLLQLAEEVLPDVQLQSFLAALGTAFLLTIINLLLGGLLAINDDDSFYRFTLRHVAGRQRETSTKSRQSLIIVEIDGLSEPALKHAITGGYAPTLKRWLDSGSHTLIEFDCGLPAQTSACQAGILYGDNFDIPAFRWYEKDTATLMVSNNPRHSVKIDARLSSRSEGLLYPDGISIGNLVTGGAREAPLTMGAIQARPRAFAREQSALYFYFLGPYNLTRTLLLMVWEVVLERWEAFQQRRHDVQPRIHRHWAYVVERAISAVFLRDLETAIILRDIYAGVPISYAMFVGYDVVAHHAGPYSRDALKVLEKIDRRIAMLEGAARDAPGDVAFAILSDHGQSTGATFRQRFGESLEELVIRLTDSTSEVAAGPVGESEGFNQFNAMLSGLIAGTTLQGKAARAVLKSKTQDDYVDVAPEPSETAVEVEQAGIIVLASGNLGLVYFKDLDGRANLDEIERAFPGLIAGLVRHEGIALAMVATSDHGTVLIGAQGTYFLQDDTWEGVQNPLADFDSNAADHFRRLDSYPHVGDIMLNSVFEPERGEVPAFEELVGSHGGLGGDQTRPFLIHPASWTPAVESINSVNDMYVVLRTWREGLQSSGRS